MAGSQFLIIFGYDHRELGTMLGSVGNEWDWV